ncbi:DUF2207 family protein [Furfurilactobacillus curtus]|uniref:Membrane protein n=1 Tax=Furfurilactobacillus curtus TaxID=1746200 RepID=A0ABQ5JS02_9LACO
MRKLTRSVLSLTITVLLLMVGTLIGRADSYDIKRYDVYIDVLANGDAEVQQQITYQFDGSFHGVFYNQDLKGIKGVSDPTVTVQNHNDRAIPLAASATGENNSFSVTKSASVMKLKVYHSIEDATATFTYRYRLNGVVTNYRDTARLNWKVIGSGWDQSLSNVKIIIQLPQQNVATLQAWAHGPLAGHTTVNRKAGQMKLTLANNPANQFIETDLLFPTSVTPNNPNQVDRAVKAQVQRQERALAKRANAKRVRARHTIYVMISIVLGIMLVSLVGTVIYLWRRPIHRHAPLVPIHHWYEVPHVGPAVAESLVNHKEADSRGYTGELLQLVAKKAVTLTSDDNTYVLAKVGQQPIDEPLTEFMIKHIGDGDQVTMVAVEKYGKRDQKGHLQQHFLQWQRRISDQVATYEDGHNLGVRRWLLALLIGNLALAGLAALLIGAGPAQIKLVWWLGLAVFAGLLTVIIIWQRQRINRYTADGDQLVNELRGLKRMLRDVGHFNTAEVGDLILWEQLLPYAAAFGLAKQVTQAVANDFGAATIATTGILFPYYYGFGNHSINFDQAFTGTFSNSISASSSALSSSSGGSGGFSGGSSGGFGGGSGGGAF